MSRSSAPRWRTGVPVFAGALLWACAAFAQGAGFETAPGSAPAIITSNSMPVVNTAPATPSSGVAAQNGDYGAFGDAAPAGMYVAPMGYGATTAPAAPVYSAQGSGAGLTPTPGYSIQAQPTTGPYANQQVTPYATPSYLPPPPQAYGAPTPDYTLQGYGSPYAPAYGAQPYYPQAAAPAYAQPAPYAAQSAAQPGSSPYTSAQRMVQGLPSAPQQPMQPACAVAPQYPMQNPMMAVPYSSGATAYGAPLPRTIGAPQQMGAAPMEGYTLGPGDKVRVTVFGEQDLSGEYQLDGNGNIRVPLLGMIRAVGYTVGQLEQALRAGLVPNYLRDPRINVEITNYRPIYVVGAVQKPGQYTYVNDMTLLNAVALAGGFTPQAKDSTVYVRHEGATEERAVETNQPLLIRPGYTVRVDTTIFWDAVNFFGPLSSPVAIAATVR
jgi:protein involved in polysaccharide export with SLBB domain